MTPTDVYIPMDRRWAIAEGRGLPEQAKGAALFADISGFTPLTAALLGELGPKRGPEQLTRQLNRVYDALITEVHRYGGSVLGFSGDAITCWLDGDDGSRATACGLAMQQAMIAFEAIPTPAGSIVSLGLKVAVAVGPVYRFRVGDPSVQYIDALAGVTLERMAAGEQQADRGDVVVAPEVVAQLGDRLDIAEVREDAANGWRFAVVRGLTDPVAPTPWPEPPPLSDADAQAWLLPPVYERLKRGQDQFLAEIRPVVALFMRFGGLDYDSDDLAGEKLDIYLRWVQRILTRHDGSLLQLTIGDKGCYLYAAFGAPLSHGDEPARAIAAALELQHPPPMMDIAGPVQIGISQGRMRTGAYGGTARRTYGVLGDEVNMAARLMGKAEVGQIMVSQRVADAASDDFLIEPLGLIKVKGKDQPIPAALVLGRRQSVWRPVHAFPNPLVGRDAELEQLSQILATAVGGSGQLIRLQGVAGVGKSHLIAEFAQYALNQGWRVVLGDCQSGGQDIPYHPWQHIFRALLVLLDDPAAADPTTGAQAQIDQITAIVNGMNPDWLVRLPLLGDLLDLPIPDNATTAAFEPHLRQESLFALLLELLTQWATAQPLLILIEDAHWLDEASADLIMALARVMSQLPLVLVIIHRPSLEGVAGGLSKGGEKTKIPPSGPRPELVEGGLGGQPILPDLEQLPHTHRLDLTDLSPEGVAAAVEIRLQGPPAPLLLEIIDLQARGNPFFVEELVTALQELGHLEQQPDGRWNLSAPLLTALREANVLRPDPAGQWALNPDVPLSAADVGLPDSIQGLVLTRLDRMLESHKLTIKVACVIGRIFPFNLLAQAHPLKTEEASLLSQVEAIEQREFTRLERPLPQLAYIFKHNITRDVAYDSLLERQQRELHQAVAEALEQLLPEAVEQLAYHYSRAGVRAKSLIYLERAAHNARREYANETALNYYRQALALEVRWEWLMGQAEMLHILGRREEERAVLEQLESLPDAPPFEVAYLWGRYYEATGDYPQATTAVERALVAARHRQDRLGQIRCLSQLGLIARRQGDYQTAKRWYEQALADVGTQESYSTDEAHALAQLLSGLTYVQLRQGAFQDATRRGEQALALSRSHQNQPDEAQALNNLGLIAYRQRRLEEAVAYHQQALTLRQAIGHRADEGVSLLNLSIAARDMGDYRQTEEYLSRAMTIQQAIGNRWEEVNIWNDLGILYQELGEFTTAQDYLQQGLALSREIGDQAGEAFLLANLGLVLIEAGDLAAAEAMLIPGLALSRQQADKDLESGFLHYLSMVSLQSDRPAAARQYAEASLTLRRELGLPLRAADDLAMLAAIYLYEGALEEALGYAEQSLTILIDCGGEGPEFPQRDYFICYQVLAAADQPTRAQTALQAAYELVMGRAKKINDPALQQSFLEQVPVNRQIMETARRLKKRDKGLDF